MLLSGARGAGVGMFGSLWPACIPFVKIASGAACFWRYRRAKYGLAGGLARKFVNRTIDLEKHYVLCR